jgi:hypothetical protein
VSIVPTGEQTASITVTLTDGGHGAFTGAFAGRHIAGTLSAPEVAVTRKLCSAESVEALGLGSSVDGTYRTGSYRLQACDTTGTALDYRVSGSIGAIVVTGTVTFATPTNLESPVFKGTFSGKVGGESQTGTATARPKGNNGLVISVTLRVT